MCIRDSAQIALILARVNALVDQAQAILDLLQNLSTALATFGGLPVLNIEGQGSTKSQQAAYLRALTDPDNPFKDQGHYSACACVILQAQSGLQAPILAIQNLLGLSAISGENMEAFEAKMESVSSGISDALSEDEDTPEVFE